jgi:CRP-like cAMP-binding protein
MATIVQHIRRHPFFEGFPEALFATFRTCAESQTFASDQVLYKQGDAAESFFLIFEGRVAQELYCGHHGALIVQTVGPGEVLGWSWLFPPYRRLFDARTITAVEAIALQAGCLTALAEPDHPLGYELYKRLSRAMVASLQAARLQLLDIYSRSPVRAPR